ncbi:dihydrofolate reductase [Canibacter zhoujuaniae]|uniref:dihydrofolate reductase n=1 Tax=Canibacter zhoujuaniae TaxID=2708343 RepID=UPI001FB8B0CE|nr:dihydrofolate reductase [Canibacter zhoujuaniae]
MNTDTRKHDCSPEMLFNVPVAELAQLARQALNPGDIGLIWAQASGTLPGWEQTPGGGAIGRAGQMPWHVPADLAWFKQVTFGAPVIMGRRTWESLPERFRPLPGRKNYVVTSAHADTVNSATFAGANILRSLDELDSQAAATPVWVIGGGQLYQTALPRAKAVVISQFSLAVADADTWAPSLDPQEWCLAAVSEPSAHTEFPVRFSLWCRR